MNKQLYAFWKYDAFPYVLGGKVRDIDDDGLVYIESFQAKFRPILILPLEKGLEIKEELNTLERLYKKKTQELRTTMIKDIIKICPSFNQFIR